MSLRARLVLVLVAVSVPLVAALTFLRGALDDRAEVEALHRLIEARMVDGRAACEADPENFPRPGRGPRGPGGPRARRGPGLDRRLGPGPAPGSRDAAQGTRVDLFAYGVDFVSANPRAPRFPSALREQLESGADRAHERSRTERGPGLRVAARMPWGEGPCAIVMVVRPDLEPRWLTRNQVITASVLAGCLVTAMFLAAGPMVARVRRLTAEVRRSARERYAEPVTVTGADELDQLARAFNDAGAEIRGQFTALEERERTLREFVSNTTHDVMIPMTVLQGHLAALRDAAGAPDPEHLRGAMEEVQYITSLIQNLGASAKLETGAPAVERGDVPLGALVERVVARHAPLAKQKGVELVVAVPEDEPVVQGDLTLLEQAVGNLVHNAVRYVPVGGHVALLLDGATGQAWSLRVVDDGPGVDEALLEQLAQRAFRADEARARYPEGQGLGLHIALEVARRHGFQLDLRRSEHGGLEAELSG